MSGFNEQAQVFGPANSLVGILTRPSAAPASPRPTVVILNTGIVHRVGHHRMYVDLARQLAAQGHDVLRFDFSGIGDSPSRDGICDPAAACLADLREALGFLQDTTGAKSFVLVGLCSGADIGLRFAASERRVVGLVLLDPTIPPTVRFYAHYIAQRMMRLRSWLTFVLGRGRIWGDVIERMKSAIAAKPPEGRSSVIDPRIRGELERVYKSLVARGTRLLIVLTGGPMQGRQSYREQLLEAFPNVAFGDRLMLEHFPDCDHTFTSKSDRERLNSLVLAWSETTTLENNHATGTNAKPDRFQNRPRGYILA